jgi:hypothetical protein
VGESRNVAALHPKIVSLLEDKLAQMKIHSTLQLGLILAVAALPAYAAQGPSTPAQRPPNLVFILSDDHSAPHLGAYGNQEIHTPNLDRFASEGFRFDRAYVGCPQCVPSRATYLTGRSPIGTQMTRFTAPLPADVVAFPELLRAAGYFTGICGRTFHLDGAANSPALQEIYARHGLKTFEKRVDFLRVSNQKKAVAELIEFLDQVPTDKPFFL